MIASCFYELTWDIIGDIAQAPKTFITLHNLFIFCSASNFVIVYIYYPVVMNGERRRRSEQSCHVFSTLCNDNQICMYCIIFLYIIGNYVYIYINL